MKAQTFWPCFGLWQSDVLHQLERERNVVNHLVNVARSQVKIVQRHKETAQQAHDNAQVNTVLEIGAQVVHFKI